MTTGSNMPEEERYWIAGTFDGGIRFYGHPDREQIEWWRDGLRMVGMTGLRGITRIIGPKTEEQMREWAKQREVSVLGTVRVWLPWEVSA